MNHSGLKSIFTMLLLAAVIMATPFSPARAAAIPTTPKLYLVSVGNGDPDNITLRAINTISKAQVVFCSNDIRKNYASYLSGKELHNTAINVHRVFMRKEGDFEKARKDAWRIEGIVRQAVAEGKIVAVLDSGDPTIYGPNMWFIEFFEDLDPEIVPGVSCFNAANAALKKGVTSGETTKSVILTNGMDVNKLAQAKTSMVFFTMRTDLEQIVKDLKPHYPAETPVAVVANAGYRKSERIIRGTLGTILEQTKNEKLTVYLVYVGDFLTRRYNIK
ncbi:SAM-dependent methyltransferase [Prosthecochloris sp.]|uniref:SAM-dependent methyltransferase n=1 Tax=Prosthecochloris sp. TaxID=290513 RepID=UPI0025FF9DD2|nr:SAM-dependent methyltransferase [Prosthecochloris sp.]